MVPHSFGSFDISRHLARGDIIFSHDMAIIIAKWSKLYNPGKRLHIFISQSCLSLDYALSQL